MTTWIFATKPGVGMKRHRTLDCGRVGRLQQLQPLKSQKCGEASPPLGLTDMYFYYLSLDFSVGVSD